MSGTISTKKTMNKTEKKTAPFTVPPMMVRTEAAAPDMTAAAATAATPAAGISGQQTANTVNTAPTVAAGTAGSGQTNHIEIHNQPTIVVNGDQPDDLEAKLEENNRKLIKEVEDMLDEKDDKEERQRYD